MTVNLPSTGETGQGSAHPSAPSPPSATNPASTASPASAATAPPSKAIAHPSRRSEGDSRPPRREYTPRPYNDAAAGDSTTDRPRKTFSKPGTFGRKREGFAGKPSFSRDSDSRPPRRDFADRPDRSSKSSFDGPRKPYTPREGAAGRSPLRRQTQLYPRPRRSRRTRRQLQ